MELGFYLIIYNDNGGLGCRLVGDSLESFSGFSIFWTSEIKFLESPFSAEEEDVYNTRHHIRSIYFDSTAVDRDIVSRILSISSSVDLVFPGVDWPSDGRNAYAEGRIWEYKSGTFGFGFLKSDFIIDLKHIALKGRLLDSVTNSIDAPSSSWSFTVEMKHNFHSAFGRWKFDFIMILYCQILIGSFSLVFGWFH